MERLEERELLAGDTYLINFQTDEATIPSRYLRDSGQTFAARGNGFSYGWSTDHSDQAFERSAQPDQRLDTLIQFEAGQYWEFALANGLYEVTVAVGDPANNDGVHTINVENVIFWDAEPDISTALQKTLQVTVNDGRLTIDSGAAADFATRINFVHIVGLASGPNAAPSAPTITEPLNDGQVVNPADVHMEAVGYMDSDGNSHKSTDWEIWTVGPAAEPVWQTLGIEGIEKYHTHQGDGVFVNSRAGEISLAPNTDHELRVRYRDDVGSVSTYSVRLFHTGPASTVFPLDISDVLTTPAPTWVDVFGAAVDLPTGGITVLAPGDAIIPIDASTPVSTSNFPVNEAPPKAIDGVIVGSKYLNSAGSWSGFIVTPGGSTTVQSFRIATANDAATRDPTSYQLWGTNSAIASTQNSTGNGEPWTLISSGPLSLPSDRNTLAPAVSFTNSTAYTSYKMYFPTVNGSTQMQIAEVSFYTGTNGAGTDVLVPADPIIAIDAGFQSASPGGETAPNAVDNNVNTKYLNFGEQNSGFIVTPASGSSVVNRFRITTANDSPERDPASWALYGTNSAIASWPHSDGTGENWTVIESGSVNLPTERLTAGPEVFVNNATAYTSYKMVFPTVRNAGDANSMQIADIQFYSDSVAMTPPKLQLESGYSGAPLLTIDGASQAGNVVTHYPQLAESHAHLRVVITAGSSNLVLNASDLTFADEDGTSRTIFLPAVNLNAGGRLDLWVSLPGGTYYGTEAQEDPDFSMLARQPTLDVPYIATQPGFVVEEVGSGYRLPVNIAFVPDPGPDPDDPLYYVTELYGSIQVVTRDGTKHQFASGLLDYNPTGPISGSGEQGLTGITVQRDELNPEIYHLYVGMLWDNGAPPGGASHYPKVERIDSAAGGLTMDTHTVLLNMQPETQGQSHQISNITIGPDGKLYVHVGDGFNAGTAQNLNQFRGKILRMNLDGTAPSDNPLFDSGDGIGPTDYIYAYGFRNPFGGAWRASDGKHYEVENGPSVDRLAQVNAGVNYGWNGSDASMFTNATYNWVTAHAPVNISFVQQSTFNGSQFPASMMDHAFVSESGPTYAAGPQANGKQLVEFELNAAGTAVVDGPDPLMQYVGTGRGSVVGLAAGPDGLYFTSLYEDSGANGPTASGARIYRVRYVNPIAGDYDIDGDVDQDDYTVWRSTLGSNLLLAADGNGNGLVDAADYVIWRRNLGNSLGAGAGTSSTTAPSQSGLSGNATTEASRAISIANVASAERTSDPVALPGRAATVPIAAVGASQRIVVAADTARQKSSTEQNNLQTGFFPVESPMNTLRRRPAIALHEHARATDEVLQGWFTPVADGLLMVRPRQSIPAGLTGDELQKLKADEVDATCRPGTFDSVFDHFAGQPVGTGRFIDFMGARNKSSNQ
jgi:glucose/arabinose dehydrogenase